MEPKQNSQNFAPPMERGSTVGPETSSGVSFEAPGEVYEQARKSEKQHSNSPVEMIATGVQMPALPTPVAVQDDSSQSGITTSPSVAADDDLIEKEWVDHAKDIISKTKDDPYMREQELNKLQIDYIRKRYGREIGSNND